MGTISTLGDGNTVTSVTVNDGQTAADQASGDKDGNLKLTETTDAAGNPTYDISLSDNVDLTDTGSLKVGGDNIDSPVTEVGAGNITVGDGKGNNTTIGGNNIDFTNNSGSITNVAGHLENQTSTDDKINPANAPDQFDDNAKHEAATLGDVLNAGWNLKVGGKDADFVQHGDTVNFADGNGTTANFTKDATTGETTISFDVSKAGNPTTTGTG
ncbi:MAG: hypothetical protein IJ881_09800, partial [Neisseriaceae bacterium]|nr:hypothetical protein [Neisseriaceae bacterium]